MVSFIILCLLFSVFGVGGLFFAVLGGILKFSLKLCMFGIILMIVLLCVLPLFLGAMIFGGLALFF